ncbi:hypothetical protein ACFOMH_18705 [Paracoccus mangrovi]|uniref:Uncharacterized protein n=1 Tax=Paracoccus mangrovi TaxID=1715645 RepID=A0ABV7R9V2_9RHOB
MEEIRVSLAGLAVIIARLSVLASPILFLFGLQALQIVPKLQAWPYGIAVMGLLMLLGIYMSSLIEIRPSPKAGVDKVIPR